MFIHDSIEGNSYLFTLRALPNFQMVSVCQGIGDHYSVVKIFCKRSQDLNALFWFQENAFSGTNTNASVDNDFLVTTE